MKEWDKAVDDFKTLVDFDPKNKEDRMLYCQALFQARKFTDAVERKIRIKKNYDIIEKLKSRFLYLKTQVEVTLDIIDYQFCTQKAG